MNLRMETVKHKYIKIFLKIFTILFLLFILLNTVLSLYIYFNQDSLKSKLIQYVNSAYAGKVSTDRIALSPLKHFPDISIELINVIYYESDSLSACVNPEPLFHFDHFYAAIDILQLLRGNIRVSEFTVEDGSVYLRLYADSTFNLLNSFATTRTDSSTVPQTNADKNVNADLLIKRIYFKNIDFQYQNDLLNKKSSLLLNTLESQLSFTSDSLICDLTTDLRLNGIRKGNKIRYENTEISSNLSFIIDFNKQLFRLNKSQLNIQGAKFDVDGMFNFNEGKYSFDINGSDHDMDFYSLLLHEDILKKNTGNLNKGNIYFNGKIEGNISREFVYLNFTFGAENVCIEINDNRDAIDSLHFSGYFTSGHKDDYSESHLNLNNLYAKLPNGHLSGNIDILNFKSPKISLQLSSKLDLQVIEKVFRTERYLKGLKGNLAIETVLKGQFDSQKGMLIRSEEKSVINLDSISFVLPVSGYNVDLLDGIISRDKENYHIDNLHFKRGATDVTVNGDLTKLIYLILNEKSDFNARLDIKASRLVIKELIGQDTSQSIILNDTLSQLHLNVDINTTTKAIRNINKFPESTITINKINSLLQTTPDIYSGKGTLKFSDAPRKFNIGFENIDLKSSAGDIKVTGNIMISDSLEQQIDFITRLKNINIDRAKTELKLTDINYSFLDSLNEVLNTDFNLLIKFSADSFEVRKFSLKKCNIFYGTAAREGALSAENIDFVIENMGYDNDDNSLKSYEGNVYLQQLSKGKMKLNNIGFHFNMEDDKYRIYPDFKTLFGDGEISNNTAFFIDLSDSVSSYRVQFKISDYNIAVLMGKFGFKKIIEGEMNLDFWAASKGENVEQLIANLNGKILANAQDLIFYGVDLDFILDKVQRLQTFNLVDISAYFIAGPLAPLATKGYDAASVITTSLGDKTNVSHFVSNWSVKNGRAEADDVALTTAKNRIAAKGIINLVENEYDDLTIAVLNRRGCSVVSQTINGPLVHPDRGKLDAIGPIRGTLESLFNLLTGKDCKPFYSGSLAHPN